MFRKIHRRYKINLIHLKKLLTNHQDKKCKKMIWLRRKSIRRKFGRKSQSVLHVISTYGSPKLANFVIKLGANINSLDKERQTPIYNAIRNPLSETYKLLVKNGANITIHTIEDRSPLQEALYYGCLKRIEILVGMPNNLEYVKFGSSGKIERTIKIIKYILQHQKTLRLTSSDFSMIVYFAARLGHDKTFEHVLRHIRKYQLNHKLKIEENELKNGLIPIRGPKEINIRGPLGQTALHFATKSELPKTVKYLLNRGADPNAKTVDSHCALHIACLREREDIIKILLKAGADVDGKIDYDENPEAQTPLLIACGGFNPNYMLRKFGFDYDGKNEDIHPNKKIVKMLLDAGAAKNNVQEKILLDAVGTNFEFFEFLISCGFDLNLCQDFFGQRIIRSTIMDCAAHKNLIEIIEAIVGYGAHIDVTCETYSTPLSFAVCWCRYEVIECLLRLNASIGKITDNHPSAFYESIQKLIQIDDISSEKIAFLAYCVMKNWNIKNLINEFEEEYERKRIIKLVEECENELTMLKNSKIKILETLDLTLYEILTLDIYSLTSYINKSAESRSNFFDGCSTYHYPCYGFLLQRQKWRINSLKDSVEKITVFLKSYRKLNLPLLIIRNILVFLKAADFRNFRKALVTE